ncbi:28S ribosomal protein S31, mitochondrial [Frankliniella fusca]|uniref:Small ribosomal subunit protein mS31 n=1 Tax=Frankliniella fusca TaxID=407009 RepID=A0AAE1GQN7_9NEOP|nr:28S ribosomal protein S31, mitochondrial [Frankliniella fusca]
MLSQVKIRLLPPGLVLRHLVKATSLSTSSVQLSSKKNDDLDEPIPDAGISEPVKRQRRLPKTAIDQDKLLDDTLKVLGPKVKFQNRKKTELTPDQASRMKPGQLNIKMTEAARKVAKKAGSNEAQVLDDILGKLDDVFVGMDNHVKKSVRKKKFLKSQPGQIPNIRPRKSNVEEEIYADLFTNEAENLSSTFRVFDKKDTVPFENVEALLQSQEPLGIFSQDSKTESGPSLKLWEKFLQAELRRNTRFEPLNWFDQCIVWTEEGKLWKFPIDNEQGMDDEANVDFTEHIFLDHHIEHWCPKEGPIKHFMELVLVGLSKNPYITVSEKIKTLQWYENYFMKHEALLKEINALGSVANPIPVEGKVTEA